MNTGENEQGLQKVLDMTRLISIVLLILHFYYYCYQAFDEWQLTAALSDGCLATYKRPDYSATLILQNIIALGFLFISLLGARGKKEETLKFKTGFIYILSGLLLYFSSWFWLRLFLPVTTLATLYISTTSYFQIKQEIEDIVDTEWRS